MYATAFVTGVCAGTFVSARLVSSHRLASQLGHSLQIMLVAGNKVREDIVGPFKRMIDALIDYAADVLVLYVGDPSLDPLSIVLTCLFSVGGVDQFAGGKHHQGF